MQRFFLAAPPAGGRARLEPDEDAHARVLRLGTGDRLIGLDGRGGAWLCEACERDARGLALEVVAEEPREPAPGSDDAALPHVELACSLPRGKRAEELLERAVPLGLARLTPLVTAHSPPHAQALAADRFARLARAACKQSELRWLPELGAPEPLDAWLARARGGEAATSPVRAWIVLSPGAGAGLGAIVAQARRAGARRFVLVVGPEGGFDARELALLCDGGAREAALGPTILRIEHAAEAALAITLHAWWSAG